MGSQNQEDLQKQQQMMQEQQAQWRKMMTLQWIGGNIRNLNKKDVLDALSKNIGPNLYCPNYMVAQQLSQKIVSALLDAPELDDHVISIQNALLSAISLTNSIRASLMYSQAGQQQNGMMGNQMMGMGMNPMMGGMMNPMMMGGMNGMQMGGFGMMNPMMGGMMGGFGMMNPMMQQNTAAAGNEEDEAKRKIQIAKDYIRTNVFQADPLIFLSMISNRIGISIDFTNDQQFEELVVQAMFAAIQQMAYSNPMIFQAVYGIIYQLVSTDYYSKLSNGKGQNNQNQAAGMMGGFGMMNPMMMGMGMNGMQMGMGMPGMMNGMMPAMDQSMMMGGMGAMGGLGMGPMMGGMTPMPGMTGMPGVGGSIF